jgi:hypothetical protein
MVGLVVVGTVRSTAGRPGVGAAADCPVAGLGRLVVGTGPATRPWLQAVAGISATIRRVESVSGRHEADRVGIVE